MTHKDKLAYTAGWSSIAVNIILAILKLFAGTISGSIAITADAWHTLSDSISSFILLIGTWVSKQPADHDHPYGHGRAEIIASLIIGILLSIVSFHFAESAFQSLFQKKIVIYGKLALGVTILSIIVKELLAQYALWVAHKTKSPSVKADAWHHRSDALSSVVILIGIIFGKNIWWLDGILAIFVAILIFGVALKVITEAINPLLGEAPSRELIDHIKNICDQENNLLPHHFHLHSYGHHQEITFHVRFPSNTSVKKAHEKVTIIEEHIRINLGIEATIHLESL